MTEPTSKGPAADTLDDAVLDAVSGGVAKAEHSTAMAAKGAIPNESLTINYTGVATPYTPQGGSKATDDYEVKK